MDPTLDYSKIPSGPPPPGVVPNFVNPQTNAPMTTIVISVLLPLMLAFVFLRIYANIWISRKFSKSDYACIVATMASISYSAVLYKTISQHIFGRHIWDVPISMNTESSVQYWSICSILYGPTIFLAKVSILLLYLELFMVNTSARIMVGIAMAIITSQCLANIIGMAVLCIPRPGASWLAGASTYRCRVVADLYGVIMGAISVFSDLFVIYIPMPVVWQLQLPVRKKVGISVIFVTGIFACLASILTLVYRIRQYKTKDNTWNASYTYMLTVVEINVSIMCSCMPFWPGYLRHHLQSLRSLRSRLRSKYFSSRTGNSSSHKLNDIECGGLKPADDDKERLTLGSAVKDGKLLESQQEGQDKQERAWPLAANYEGEECGKGPRPTTRESWGGSTSASFSSVN